MDFKTFIEKSFVYFDKDPKKISKAAGLAWQEECGRYPGEFFDWAFNQVKSLDTGKVILSNPPKCVNDLWNQWMRANPQKVERKEFTCPHCHYGWILFYRQEKLYDGQWHVFSAHCGECNTLPRSSNVAFYKAWEIESKGWLILNGANALFVEEDNKRIRAEAMEQKAKHGREVDAKGSAGFGCGHVKDAIDGLVGSLPF